ncbi:MAG: T9SS type A sorting domain-containing protein [Flavobacteriales bacterium]|nr:T9SS type A sorting domain-containing protein [Flavobacteriales bacterium]
MKNQLKSLFLFVALCVTANLCAQTPVWLSHYGNGTQYVMNEGLSLTMDGAGHLYGTGSIYGPSFDFDGHQVSVAGGSDIVLVKLDSLGHAIWARGAGGGVSPMQESEERGSEITYDAVADHILVTGRYDGEPATFGTHQINGHLPFKSLFVAAYDTNGECLWVKGSYGNAIFPGQLLTDNASNVFVFGESGPVGGLVFQGPPDVSVPVGSFLAKYSATGTLLHVQRILNNGSVAGVLWVEGDWVITGAYQGASMLWDQPLTPQSTSQVGFLARTDTAGNIQWLTTVHSDSVAFLNKVASTSTGDLVVTGTFKANLFIGNDTLTAADPDAYSKFVALFSSTGQPQWGVALNGTDHVQVLAVAVSPNDEIYILAAYERQATLGGIPLPVTTRAELLVARFDTIGTVQAALTMGVRGLHSSGSILANNHGVFVSAPYDSTLVCADESYPISQLGATDLFVAKFNTINGFTNIQSMDASGEQLHIYANPNNGLCTIDLPEHLRITSGLVLSIYDNTGQLVQRVPLTTGSAGLKLDIRAQAKGIYHVELGDGVQRYSGSIVFE